MDQEGIKRRMSQIELEINEMNQMIDENLQLDNQEEPEGNACKSFSQLTANAGNLFVQSAESQDKKQIDTKGQSREVLQSMETKETDLPLEPQESGSPEEKVLIAEGIATEHPFQNTTAKQLDGTSESGRPVKATEVGSKTEEPVQDAVTTHPVGETAIEQTIEENTDKTSTEESEDEEFVESVEIDEQKIESLDKHGLEGTNEQSFPHTTIQEPVPASSAAGIIHPSVKIDHCTDTSEDIFDRTRNSTPVSESSPPPLSLPKHRDMGAVKPTGTRRSTNPFRVVSVSSSRKCSNESVENNSADDTAVQKLQKRHDYLTMKTIKLQKEIKYLTRLREQGTLPLEDSKKLCEALVKLQEYLDRKTKEKYEVGVLLSRQIRKHIDRGNNGQFWVGDK